MPRAILPITLQAIRRAKPGDEIRDGAFPGLSLRVYATQATWTLTTRTAGRRVRILLGEHPHISIPDARARAAGKRDELLRYHGSQNPNDASGPHKKRIETLSTILGLYSHTARQNASWYDQEKRILSVFRPLLDAPALSLTLAEIQRAADAHPSPASASAGVRYLRPLLKWGRKRGHFQPTMDERDLEQPRAPSCRDRTLSRGELTKLLSALTYEGYDGAARWMLATGARREEVCGATWREIVNDVWTIPGSRRKNRRALSIPLSSYALDVLARVLGARVLGGAPRACDAVIFQGVDGGALCNWDRWQKQCFQRTGTSGWHRHDLRRTVATIAGEAGADPHVVEILLGHADPHTPLASTYNKSRYVPEHLSALESVGSYLRELEKAGAVAV